MSNSSWFNNIKITTLFSGPIGRKRLKVSILVVFVLAFLTFIAGCLGFKVNHVALNNKIIPASSKSAAIDSTDPEIKVTYSGVAPSIDVHIDGVEVPVSRNIFLFHAVGKSHTLNQGKHNLQVKCGSFSYDQDFFVDTVAPQLKISHPQPGFKANKKTISLQGTTDGQITVKIFQGQQIFEVTSDKRGFFAATIPCSQGKNTIKCQAEDYAGNKTSTSVEFFCDSEVAEVNPKIVQKDGKLTATPKDYYPILSDKNLILKVSAADPESGISEAEAIIDGEKCAVLESDEDKALRESTEDEEDHENSENSNFEENSHKDLTQNLKEDSSNEDTSKEAKSNQKIAESSSCPVTLNYTYPLPNLTEGRHEVQVVVTNGMGLSTKRGMRFVLDSTDNYGEATLSLGAMGKDVQVLQDKLERKGYLKPPYPHGKYDECTREAVKELQRQSGFEPDGVAGQMVYGALGKRIYVNLSRFSAVLVTEDDQEYRYSVSTGVKDHPTPTGAFYVADMAVNPSWLPPASDWAKDSKVIPPGPDNPLGTRWIGLDNGTVGFHGTPYPDSVGTAASHGCMRMTIPDVEDLYDRVSIGTPVRIFSGNEDDPNLHKYWP